MLKFVVALFESKGIAEDACNRLRIEGTPDGDISLVLLRETAPCRRSRRHRPTRCSRHCRPL